MSYVITTKRNVNISYLVDIVQSTVIQYFSYYLIKYEIIILIKPPNRTNTGTVYASITMHVENICLLQYYQKTLYSLTYLCSIYHQDTSHIQLHSYYTQTT